MQLRNVVRRIAIFGVAAVAAGSVTAGSALAAPTAAQAHRADHPGWLLLSPKSGLLTDNPIANYSTTKACPKSHRALAAVTLAGEGDAPIFVGGNFVPTHTPPSGTLNSTSLRSVVLANNLTTGYYEIDLLCFNDDFSGFVKADRNWIRIDVEAGTWRRILSWLPLRETR